MFWLSGRSSINQSSKSPSPSPRHHERQQKTRHSYCRVLVARALVAPGMSNRRSSFLDPERRRFLVKRVSLAPGPDPDDEVVTLLREKHMTSHQFVFSVI
ncbi:hypothetical protein J6590_053509 [Homalodisca vitripennis]|nr:hypothetical protein J6590_053509 [Homalodisca vitripennis]